MTATCSKSLTWFSFTALNHVLLMGVIRAERNDNFYRISRV